MYYCMCKCPDELKTMNNVNDIQMAGISRSKYKLFQFPWNRVPTVQLFTVDTKLVQLMRFYYTLSSLLCLNNNGDRVRLLLLNGNRYILSNVSNMMETIVRLPFVNLENVWLNTARDKFAIPLPAKNYIYFCSVKLSYSLT